MDSRIGPKFLKASVGFGGSCFQKDILNLVYLCQSMGLNDVAEYFNWVVRMNDLQKERFVSRIIHGLFNTVTGKRIALLGFAFKKDTGDTRESASIEICRRLIEEKAEVAIYDPKVEHSQIWLDLNYVTGLQKNELERLVKIEASVEDAARSAHALVIATEWDEFKKANYEKIYENMSKPAFLFDGRNVINRAEMNKIGFVTYCIGKPLDETLNTV